MWRSLEGLTQAVRAQIHAVLIAMYKMTRRRILVAAALLAGCLLTPRLLLSQTSPATFDAQVSPLLVRYCTGCHGGKTPVAGVHLDLKTEPEARKITQS